MEGVALSTFFRCDTSLPFQTRKNSNHLLHYYTVTITSMASGARIFNGCRALFAAAKSAAPKSTASAKKSTKQSTEKPAKKPTAEKSIKPTAEKSIKPTGILKLTPISPALGNFLGVSESARTYAVKKIWEYIKLHDLQNPLNKREIICDDKLKTIFEGKEKVGFLEIGKLLSPHFLKTA